LQIDAGWDWHLLWMHLGRVSLAYAIAVPLGFEREREAHSAGLRTFPLVAMASCAYVLLAQSFTSDPAATSRVLQGLVAGIGFIGGGAILKDGMTIHGTATAASIWNVGAIGTAIGVGRFEIAIVLAVLNLITLHFLLPLKKKLGAPPE
jgi:putative Mg2+ transporter-C (MgtC) family protein